MNQKENEDTPLDEILSFATKKSMTTSPKWLYVWF